MGYKAASAFLNANGSLVDNLNPTNVAKLKVDHYTSVAQLYLDLRAFGEYWNEGHPPSAKKCAAMAYKYWNDEETAVQIAERDEKGFMDEEDAFGSKIWNQMIENWYNLNIRGLDHERERATQRVHDALCKTSYIAKLPDIVDPGLDKPLPTRPSPEVKEEEE